MSSDFLRVASLRPGLPYNLPAAVDISQAGSIPLFRVKRHVGKLAQEKVSVGVDRLDDHAAPSVDEAVLLLHDDARPAVPEGRDVVEPGPNCNHPLPIDETPFSLDLRTSQSFSEAVCVVEFSGHGLGPRLVHKERLAVDLVANWAILAAATSSNLS